MGCMSSKSTADNNNIIDKADLEDKPNGMGSGPGHHHGVHELK
jgi:hypothetical protein